MKRIVGIFASLIFCFAAMAQEQIDFRLVLPDSWELVSYSEEENLWAYESKDGNHRVTVSVLYYSDFPNHSQQGQFLSDFIKTRRKQSSQLAPEIKFGEINVKEYDTAWVAKFDENSTDGRYASTKTISSKVGIANFYLESFSSREKHDEIRSSVLSTTGFAS